MATTQQPQVDFVKAISRLDAIALVVGSMIGSGIFIVSAEDRKSTRLNSSHSQTSYAVFCLKKKNQQTRSQLQAAHPQSETLRRLCLRGVDTNAIHPKDTTFLVVFLQRSVGPSGTCVTSLSS